MLDIKTPSISPQKIDTPIDFTALDDATIMHVPIGLLLDSSFGNKRLRRPARDDLRMQNDIKLRGVLQPVLARVNPSDPFTLELLAGYGRRNNSKVIGLTHIPVNIRKMNDGEAYAAHLSENITRTDLSLVERVYAAKEYNTLYEGDRESMAIALSWSIREVNECLELGKCTDKVLKALDAGHIKPQHAICLAPFADTVQDKQLDNIINQAISVQLFREMVGKRTLSLGDAKFDTTECSTCPHNAGKQQGLFDNVEQNAQCAKPACYREKTTVFYGTEKERLKSRYGNVMFISELDSSGIAIVSADVVGEQQYIEGCTPCRSRIAVLNDKPGQGEGLVTQNQCIDRVCFKKCQTAFDDAVEGALAESGIDEIACAEPAAVAATKEKAKKQASITAPKVSNGKLSSVAVEQDKKVLRQASAEHFTPNRHYNFAVVLASVAFQSGYVLPNCVGSRFADVLLHALHKMSLEEIQKHTPLAIRHLSFETQNTASCDDVTILMIKALKADTANAVSVATKAWTPSTENLEHLTKSQLVGLAQEAKADKAIDAISGDTKVSFNGVSGGRKDVFITAIQEAKVDYLSFAPASFLAHVQ